MCGIEETIVADPWTPEARARRAYEKMSDEDKKLLDAYAEQCRLTDAMLTAEFDIWNAVFDKLQDMSCTIRTRIGEEDPDVVSALCRIHKGKHDCNC